jgi:hypothetical protein
LTATGRWCLRSSARKTSPSRHARFRARSGSDRRGRWSGARARRSSLVRGLAIRQLLPPSATDRVIRRLPVAMYSRGDVPRAECTRDSTPVGLSRMKGADASVRKATGVGTESAENA